MFSQCVTSCLLFQAWIAMSSSYSPGARARIIDGAFANFDCTIIAERDGKIDVNVEIFGRSTPVTVDPKELLVVGAELGLDTMLAEVDEAVSRRGFNQRRLYWWAAELTRRGAEDVLDDQLAEWVVANDAFEAQLREEEEAARAVERARVVDRFEEIPSDARVEAWIAERGAWTEWRSHSSALEPSLDESVLPRGAGSFATDDERTTEIRRRVEAGRVVRSRVRSHRRTYGLASAFAGHEHGVATSRNHDLEAAIDRAPDDDSGLLVYGDWLATQGDVRGELVALQAQELHGPRVATFFRKHGRAVLGALEPFQEDLKATWRCGFIDRVTVNTTRDDEKDGVEVAALLFVLLALPAARFVRELTIHAPSVHETGPEAVHAALVAAGPRRSLTRLTFETDEGAEMLSWTSAGDLSRLSELYPRLRVLRVHTGTFVLGGPGLPLLEELLLETCHLKREALQAIAALDWPALRVLKLWVGSSSYGVDISCDDLLPLLQGARMPELATLGIMNCELTDALVELLPRSALLPRLRELDLSMGTLSDEGARTLVDGEHRSSARSRALRGRAAPVRIRRRVKIMDLRPETLLRSPIHAASAGTS
jgi:uncharacterized protein (TIGR02996 family)